MASLYEFLLIIESEIPFRQQLLSCQIHSRRSSIPIHLHTNIATNIYINVTLRWQQGGMTLYKHICTKLHPICTLFLFSTINVVNTPLSKEQS